MQLTLPTTMRIASGFSGCGPVTAGRIQGIMTTSGYSSLRSQDCLKMHATNFRKPKSTLDITTYVRKGPKGSLEALSCIYMYTWYSRDLADFSGMGGA